MRMQGLWIQIELRAPICADCWQGVLWLCALTHAPSPAAERCNHRSHDIPVPSATAAPVPLDSALVAT